MVVLQDFVSGATRVAVAGDWHGDVVPVRRILSKVARQGAQVVLHVGDFGYFPGRVEYWAFIAEVNARAELHDYVVVFVEGNHEQFNRTVGSGVGAGVGEVFAREGLNDLRACADGDGFVRVAPRVFWATRGASLRIGDTGGRRGLSFLGLGGAGSINREHMRFRGEWSKSELVTAEDVEAVKAGVERVGGVVDIMVTHDAPAGAYMPRKHSGAPTLGGRGIPVPSEVLRDARQTREHIADAVAVAKPMCLFHGHWHSWNQEAQVPIRDTIVPMVTSLAEEHGTNNLLFTDTTLWNTTDSELRKRLYSNRLWFP